MKLKMIVLALGLVASAASQAVLTAPDNLGNSDMMLVVFDANPAKFRAVDSMSYAGTPGANSATELPETTAGDCGRYDDVNETPGAPFCVADSEIVLPVIVAGPLSFNEIGSVTERITLLTTDTDVVPTRLIIPTPAFVIRSFDNDTDAPQTWTAVAA